MSQEQFDFTCYPNLNKSSSDLLEICYQIGLFSTNEGRAIVQKVEDYFAGKEIVDKQLSESIKAWYNGTFSPGYYMNDNNAEFARYLKSKISIRVFE